MCNHMNLKILIHIFTIIYLIMIIIVRREHFVAYLDGLGGTPVCRGTPVAITPYSITYTNSCHLEIA
jgi:hypothetical protein